MLFDLNNWICSELINKKDIFFKNSTKIIRFILDQTWLKGNNNLKFKHYYFHIAELLRGQNQPVDQVAAAALLKYGQICTSPMCDFGPILRNQAYYTLLPNE